MRCKKPERAARHLDKRASPLPPSLPAYAMPHAGKVAVSFTQAGMGTGAREEEDWMSGKARRTSEEFVQSETTAWVPCPDRPITLLTKL